MLWEKERKNRGSIYVNILGSDIDELYSMFNQLYTVSVLDRDETSTKKDDERSMFLLFSAATWSANNVDPEQILPKINAGLCYAEIDSEHCGYAYALRAGIFHKLKQYSLCLVDIDLAKKNNIPSRRMALLEELENDCLEKLAMDDGKKAPRVRKPKLSFPADTEIPCFAQGLEMMYSKKFGKHVVTNRKLEIGQTVFIEEAFCIRSENQQNYAQCANCFASGGNLIPCKNCAAVLFCSQSCYDIGHEKFHARECGQRGVHTSWEAARRIVVQTVIEAIKLLPRIEELMDVIEKFMDRKRNGERNSETAYADPSVRAYMQFFGLRLSVMQTPGMQDMQFIDYAKSIHSHITKNPLYESKFRSLESRRFLAHLILHHFYVVDSMGCDALNFLHGTHINELGLDSVARAGFAYAHGIYLNSSRLNHSCQPNIGRIFIGNKVIGKVIRPIKPGEQLFVTYL